MVADSLNSNATRAAAYAVAALALMHAGRRDRSDTSRRDPQAWPAFWFVAAGLMVAMALGRVLDVASLVTELGRSRARADGWYESRRWLQLAMVGAVTAVGVVLVRSAIGRVLARRRHYVLTAVVVAALTLFAAVRLVSLHWIDALLHEPAIGGVRIATFAELALVALTIVGANWRPQRCVELVVEAGFPTRSNAAR